MCSNAFYQFRPRFPMVHGAVIPQSADITATGSTLGTNPVHCNDIEGWAGNGIVRADCAAAIGLFYSTSVRPHGNQKYEFLNRDVHRVTHLPSVVTPTNFFYGDTQHSALASGLSHSINESGHLRLYRSNDEFIQSRDAARRSAKGVPKK